MVRIRARVMGLFAVILLIAAACSNGDRPEVVADPTPTETPTEVETDATATATATEEPTEDPTATTEPTEESEEVVNDVIIASSAVRQITAYEEIDGAPVPTDLPLTNPTHFGNQLALRVVDGEEGDEWVQVLLPTRPNNTLGWVNTEGFNWETNNYRVVVDVGETTVTVYEGEEVLAESQAVVGRPERPTPIVSTYIDEKISNANGAFGSAYGTWIVSLAAFSDTLEWFDGGVPKIALHGTNAPDLVGQRLSSGCVRLPNEIIDLIAENVPVGARVDIVA